MRAFLKGAYEFLWYVMIRFLTCPERMASLSATRYHCHTCTRPGRSILGLLDGRGRDLSGDFKFLNGLPVEKVG